MCQSLDGSWPSDEDWFFIAKPCVVHRSRHLSEIKRTFSITDRVDSGPRDRRHAIATDPPRCRLVFCTEETCGNVVPHGRKNKALSVYNVGRFNAIALPPQHSNHNPLTRGPFTCQPPCHVAPHTGVRVDPRGLLPCVRATCASRGPRMALPRGLSVASHQCAGPACHVSLCAPRQLCQVCGTKPPLFVILGKKNSLKISIKIKLKIPKKA